MSINRVFVSSVVTGFEAERQAVREAVELLDLNPVMCEDFGARPYSSELACIAEVEQSDAFVLVMGSEYGYETDEGVSVTQAEFRAAQRTHRPILAFLEDIHYTGKQAEFKREVDAYQGGLFREVFSNPAQLKDCVTRALNRVKSADQAITPSQFEAEAEEALSKLSDSWSRSDEPELFLIFKPQPARRVNLTAVENSLDDLFMKACRFGYGQMRDGFEPVGGPSWVGLKSGTTQLTNFSDGLVILTKNPAPDTSGLFAGNFLPPEVLQTYARNFLELIDASSGFVQFGLRNMENGYVAQHPGGDSLSMNMWDSGDGSSCYSQLFVPLSPGEYLAWIEWCVGEFRRQYPYEHH